MYLSVDPAMRCMMDGPSHPQLGHYQQPYVLDRAAHGGGIGRVLRSNCEGVEEGDLIAVPFLGFDWALIADVDIGASAADVIVSAKHDGTAASPSVLSTLLAKSPSLSLGALGLTGLTAYFCMMRHGRPTSGDTVVVSGAAGATGTIAGQLAVNAGARVIGVCGSERKCEHLTDTLGFHAAIDYKSSRLYTPGAKDGPDHHSLEAALDAALEQISSCGVDVYLDNVGGEVSDAVLWRMNEGGRVPVCGQISQYNTDTPYLDLVGDAGVRSDELRERLRRLQVARGRFLVLDYEEEFAEALESLARDLASDSLHAPETVFAQIASQGSFNPGAAFVEMMQGTNLGKTIVRVCEGSEA